MTLSAIKIVKSTLIKASLFVINKRLIGKDWTVIQRQPHFDQVDI